MKNSELADLLGRLANIADMFANELDNQGRTEFAKPVRVNRDMARVETQCLRETEKEVER